MLFLYKNTNYVWGFRARWLIGGSRLFFVVPRENNHIFYNAIENACIFLNSGGADIGCFENKCFHVITSVNYVIYKTFYQDVCSCDFKCVTIYM